MKKLSVILAIFLLFVFLAACNGDLPVVVVTVHPSAGPLLLTMTEIAKTVEVLEQSATAYAATITPSLTPAPPTKTPDLNEVNMIVSTAVHENLNATFGADITVTNVTFGPVGAKELTHFYIELNCRGDNNTLCPSTQAVISVVDACKVKKKDIRGNIPFTIQTLIITIFDPLNSPKVIEADWSDVVAYVDGEIPAEIFSKLIRYVQ